MATNDIDLLSPRGEPEFQAWLAEQEESAEGVAPALAAKSAAA